RAAGAAGGRGLAVGDAGRDGAGRDRLGAAGRRDHPGPRVRTAAARGGDRGVLAEPPGFLGGAAQRARLVPCFLVLRLRIAVGDHAAAGLDVHDAVLEQRRAQDDAGVDLAAGGDVAGRAGVADAALDR